MLHATATVLFEFEELYKVLLFFESKGRYGNVVEREKFMQGVGNTVYQWEWSPHHIRQFHSIRIYKGWQILTSLQSQKGLKEDCCF